MNEDGDVRVEEIMTTPLETITADTTVREAARRMSEHDVHALFVPGSTMGIVTSTDVLDAVAEDRNLDEAEVGDVMTAPVESVTETLRAQEAAAMMTTYGFNHLPVRDRDGDYVGMVSSTDLREQLSEPGSGR